MKCIRCGKIFASHTDGSELCWDCYLKDFDNYLKDNFTEDLSTGRPSNCDASILKGFGKQEGWICPVCGRGVAPWASYCPCQINRNITYASGTGGYVNNDITKYDKYAISDSGELIL